MKDIYLYIL